MVSDETRPQPQHVQSPQPAAAAGASVDGERTHVPEFWQAWADALCDSASALYACADRFDADLPLSRAIRESADALHDKSEEYMELANQLRAKERMTHAAR